MSLNNEPHTEDVDMKWFDDIVEGSDSSKGDMQILSKLWQQMTGENMLTRLMSPQQRYAGKIWSTLCHRCDISYPSCDKLKVVDLFDAKNISEINLIRYAIRHAIASYPPPFVVFLGLKADVASAFKSTPKLLQSVFGIQAKDIIVDHCSNNFIFPKSVHQPSFYLCVDHKKSKIVISIRGSSSIADALTDVNAISKSYAAYGIKGYVHEGIMASTRFVFDKVTKQLVLLCNKYKYYQVIITGHSLGGGVAALLGLMYNEHPIICKQNKLRIYAFASPCVISKEFNDANIGIDYITTIVLSTDLVTRLSLQSVKQQNCRLDEIMKYDTSVHKQCVNNVKHQEEKEEDLIKRLKEIHHPQPKEQLFPVGKILWLIPKAALDHNNERRRTNLMRLNNENMQVMRRSGRRNSLSELFSKTLYSINSNAFKYSFKYDGSNYMLCDATSCRSIFQELVLDLPESLFSHMPNRYIWACDAHLTRGN